MAKGQTWASTLLVALALNPRIVFLLDVLALVGGVVLALLLPHQG